ncbi:D-aspartate oxidase-like protein [Dinothrombium tinctorium]|uniref:D-aspartate oxidase-like protein n=1 Tax=Dinothrombium tinctorium TaxID=1965070 RepID=A0A3S3NMQ8_9ACAR|nr:D-aspartate oxidase-like protein [Dinothrombium tinctorium]RWS02526.1 D-aspartate oxidase-like protein [Dinothrombium tinctorium]
MKLSSISLSSHDKPIIMDATNENVAVLGAGIIGVCSALCLVENEPNLNVTLISAKLSPDTTSDNSGGLIMPYLIGNVADERLNFWCKKTFDFLLNIYKSPFAVKAGVSLISAYALTEQEEDEAAYIKKGFINVRKLSEEEIRRFSAEYKHGYFVTTLYAECKMLLPFLMEKFKEKGGRIRVQTVEKLEQLMNEFDLVVNCTGLGSYELVSDKRLYPIRGQVLRVKAPWVKHCVMAGNNYVIPNTECVVLGGTKQKGEWNLAVDGEDHEHISQGCLKIFKNLQSAQTICESVCLRPYRDEPLLEMEIINFNGKRIPVIHNYGHGGCGVTLAWGCAQEVHHLVKKWLLTGVSSRTDSTFFSKL